LTFVEIKKAAAESRIMQRVQTAMNTATGKNGPFFIRYSHIIGFALGAR
jgi:hypothetical protein